MKKIFYILIVLILAIKCSNDQLNLLDYTKKHRCKAATEGMLLFCSLYMDNLQKKENGKTEFYLLECLEFINIQEEKCKYVNKFTYKSHAGTN